MIIIFIVGGLPQQDIKKDIVNAMNESNSKLAVIAKPCRYFVLLIFGIAYMQIAQAQRVQPMVFEIEPIGPKASTSLRIENTQQNSMTVEIVSTKIIMDEYGRETEF